MNPKTTVSDEEVKAIFAKYKLAENPSIQRITIGFTNEIHQVDSYILKVYVRQDGEKNFEKESSFYKSLHGRVPIPRLVTADKSKDIIDRPFIIYKMIEGEPLGSQWHLLNNGQREAIVSTVCNQLQIIRSSAPEPRLEQGKTWRDQILSAIHGYLDVVSKGQLLTPQTVAAINQFLEANQQVLEKETLGLTYWDLHLDNIIVNQAGELVGIVDFEHVDVVSIDYLLNIIRQMVRYPHLSLSQEMEVHANKDDYRKLMGWFREYYPELFDFPDLDKRIDLYELEALLRLLPRFPKTRQIHERIALMLQ